MEEASQQDGAAAQTVPKKVQLGFMVKPTSVEELSYNSLPNKVGGKPVISASAGCFMLKFRNMQTWLELSALPSLEELKCPRCEVTMPLMLQVSDNFGKIAYRTKSNDFLRFMPP